MWEFDADGERGAALVEACGFGDAVDLQAGNFQQASDQSLQQGAFVFVDGCVGRFDGGASFIYPGCAGIIVPTLRKARRVGHPHSVWLPAEVGEYSTQAVIPAMHS